METTTRLSFADALSAMNWRQGEHVTLIGPNGTGKTELEIRLLERRHWAIFLGTKQRDSTQEELRRMGWRTIATAEELNPEIDHHYILRPPFPRNASAASLKTSHRDTFRNGLMRAFRQTGWCIAVDEARYIIDFLGLKDEMMLLWLQGRSQGNTVICATQRPRFIPLEAYDQAKHLFIWNSPDVEDLKRNADFLGNVNRREIVATLQGLNYHDVLYVNAITGQMFITNTRWE